MAALRRLMRRQESARLGSDPGHFLATLWSSGRLNSAGFVCFPCVMCLSESAIVCRYLGFITVMFRDVSVVLSGAFKAGRESLSAAGALLMISPPVLRGWSGASTQ